MHVCMKPIDVYLGCLNDVLVVIIKVVSDGQWLKQPKKGFRKYKPSLATDLDLLWLRVLVFVGTFNVSIMILLVPFILEPSSLVFLCLFLLHLGITSKLHA